MVKMVYAICYKTKEPVYYNKGTKWEKTNSEFLARYGCVQKEENYKLVERLNAHDEAALKFCNISPEKLATIDYFFVNYQEDLFSGD